MRKLIPAIVLSLLLLVGQQGAAWHEIGHLGGAASAGEPHKLHAGDRPCATCLAFAQLGAGAQPEVPALAPQALAFATIGAAALRCARHDAPAPRSRGPPLS